MTACTTRDLAAICGTSLRTLQRRLRDLDIVPTPSERDRRIGLVDAETVARLRDAGFCDGPAEPELPDAPASLTTQERRMLRYMRSLNQTDRAFVMSMLTRMIDPDKREYRRERTPA